MNWIIFLGLNWIFACYTCSENPVQTTKKTPVHQTQNFKLGNVISSLDPVMPLFYNFYTSFTFWNLKYLLFSSKINNFLLVCLEFDLTFLADRIIFYNILLSLFRVDESNN
jgi:hypothetical protein